MLAAAVRLLLYIIKIIQSIFLPDLFSGSN